MTPTKVPAPKPKAELVCPDCGSPPNRCVQNKPGQGSCRGLVMPCPEDLRFGCYCDHCLWIGSVYELRSRPQSGFGINKPGKSAAKQFVPHKGSTG